MSTSTHPIAPEEVMAFLDKELSDAEAREVSSHLERCAECRVIAEKLRGTSRSISEWSVPAVPRTVEDTVKELASKKGSGGKIGRAGIFVRASFWSWKQWTVGIGTTAAVLLMFFSALTAGRIQRYAVTVDRPRVEAEHKGISVDNTPVVGQASAPQAGKESSVGGTVGKLPAEGELTNDQESEVLTGQIPAQTATGFALGTGSGNGRANQSAPMIARRASLAIVTKDFVAARASLDAILARRHGYAAQLNVSTAENAPRLLQASLSIPAAELASAVGDLKTLGRVENESQSGEEVTQQHADLVARLKNSRETEQRLQAILTQRTGKIADVLEVEREIARVRGEIEGMEAEQKNLEHRVDFATVNLQLGEEYKAQLNPPAASISTRLHNSMVAGYHNASETILGFFLFFAESGPTLLIWLVIILVPLWVLWRRYRRSLAAA